jgi:hypothetical protein
MARKGHFASYEFIVSSCHWQKLEPGILLAPDKTVPSHHQADWNNQILSIYQTVN